MPRSVCLRSNLATAQEHKLGLICEKLQLEPGMRLLDIGCGSGSLAAYASRHYGVEVLGITVSRRQAESIRERLADLPVQVALCDYRQLPLLQAGRFDRIASVGMFEHVGRRNDTAFHRIVHQSLEADGLALLQTIGTACTDHGRDDWIDTHVFPADACPLPVSSAEVWRACS